MTPGQLREARRLLGWSRIRLAALSETERHVIDNYEFNGRSTRSRAPAPPPDPVAAMRATLEAAGVEFTAEGAKLRRRGRKPDEAAAV